VGPNLNYEMRSSSRLSEAILFERSLLRVRRTWTDDYAVLTFTSTAISSPHSQLLRDHLTIHRHSPASHPSRMPLSILMHLRRHLLTMHSRHRFHHIVDVCVGECTLPLLASRSRNCELHLRFRMLVLRLEC
jgi:hypothetical protein